MTRVTLFSKPKCQLCDEVKEVIERVRLRRPFELEVRNVLDNPADCERYHTAIPVVLVNGREIARYRLSDARLEYALNNPT